MAGISRRFSVLAPISIAVVAAIVFAHSFIARSTWSVTLDETFYLANAVDMVQTGRLPPTLAQSGVAPLPIVLSYLAPAWRVGDLGRPAPWVGMLSDRYVVDEARAIHAAVVAFPLALIVLLWIGARSDAWHALFAASFVALSPTLAAHGSLATTDCLVADGILLSTLAASAYWRRPGRWRLFWLAAAMAFAFSAKYSAAFFLPIALAVVLLRRPANRGLMRSGLDAVMFAILTLLLVWAFHGFQMVNHRGSTRPEFFDAVYEQWRHQKVGHDAFLMGEKSKRGWWHYFPMAFAFKSTPAELILASAAALWGAYVVAFRFRWGFWKAEEATTGLWIAVAVLYWLAAMSSSVQIGHRFLLPVYPLQALIGFEAASRMFTGRRRVGFVLLAGLTAMQAVSAIGASPHYLSYFNALCGGPNRGRFLLADSNIDWGQDLPALKSEMVRRNCPLALLRYFGTALPVAYGIDFVRFNAREAAGADACGCVAISVTDLQGVYWSADPFRPFREIEPDGRAGYSILMYDARRPEVQAAVQTTLAALRAGAEIDNSNRPKSLDAYLE